MRIRDPGWRQFGSGIRDGKNSRIRDKHPGSATLPGSDWPTKLWTPTDTDPHSATGGRTIKSFKRTGGLGILNVHVIKLSAVKGGWREDCLTEFFEKPVNKSTGNNSPQMLLANVLAIF
jgi:hypothetical protein